ESLLEIDEDRLSGDRGGPEPQGLAECSSMRREAGGFPAPFVLFKARAKFAEREQRERLVEMSVGEILAGRERAAVARNRLAVAVERAQRDAAIVPCARMIGNRGERSIERRDR